ncbi:transposase tnpA, partial [mine drainage metagenome]
DYLQVALDGKTVRSSMNGEKRARHIVDVLLPGLKVAIAHREVDVKSNEISAIQPLCDPLDLEGKMVSLDAMHTQVELAKYLVEEKKADYVLTVKKNQPSLYEAIQEGERLGGLAFSPVRSVRQQRAMGALTHAPSSPRPVSMITSGMC